MSQNNCDSVEDCSLTENNGDKSENEIIPGYSDMEQLKNGGFKLLMEAIKHSNALPSDQDWNFYSAFDSFSKLMNAESSNVLQLMNLILQHNDIDSNIKNKILDEKTELVVEANDVILEKVAINIDEMNGLKKTITQPVIIQTVSAELPINGSWNHASNTNISVGSTSSQNKSTNRFKLITANNIVRPQKLFKDKIDNSENYPWMPRITEKPNSLKPLAIFLEEYEDRQEFSHPYEFELDRFSPTPEQLLESEPEFPKPLSETPLIEICDAEQLDELVETLRGCKEFAVDLEHHSYRSFMGFTCLMQISTKEKDYIIDTLALRDKLYMLNEVFTKPTIVKIFHGADKDVLWLQRDLSIYVVNMFDTYRAAKVLEYSGLSLAFLMKTFCNVIPNKQFQLADWRIRPLPEELKTYAREDTHYLIYIYEMLKKELFAKGNKSDHLLRIVMEHSTGICKKRYFKPLLNDDSHLDMYRRCNKLFDNRQMFALKELYFWRDRIARAEDESSAYVLPNHMMLQISEVLPRAMQGIIACCSPVPPLVPSNLLELHNIVLKARDQPLEKPILKEDTRDPGVLREMSKINMDSPLHCPFDSRQAKEMADNLPTLLYSETLREENRNAVKKVLNIEKATASYSIFNIRGNSDEEGRTERGVENVPNLRILSPYQRYKLTKSFVQSEVLAQSKAEEQKPDNGGDDSRTDEERIASVREHYLNLSKSSTENRETEQRKQQTLTEMGGSRRKRKRDSSGGSDVYHPDYRLPENSLHTPVPAVNSHPLPGSKRRSDQFNVDRTGTSAEQERETSARRPRQGKKRSVRDVHREGDEQARQAPNHSLPDRSSGAHKKFRPSSDFVPYDYSSVDFRQFQGGAGGVSGATQFKPKFKPKSWKKKENRGARSSTFSNSQARGRNR